jgi:hypothetical protein
MAKRPKLENTLADFSFLGWHAPAEKFSASNSKELVTHGWESLPRPVLAQIKGYVRDWLMLPFSTMWSEECSQYFSTQYSYLCLSTCRESCDAKCLCQCALRDDWCDHRLCYVYGWKYLDLVCKQWQNVRAIQTIARLDYSCPPVGFFRHCDCSTFFEQCDVRNLVQVSLTHQVGWLRILARMQLPNLKIVCLSGTIPHTAQALTTKHVEYLNALGCDVEINYKDFLYRHQIELYSKIKKLRALSCGVVEHDSRAINVFNMDETFQVLTGTELQSLTINFPVVMNSCGPPLKVKPWKFLSQFFIVSLLRGGLPDNVFDLSCLLEGSFSLVHDKYYATSPQYCPGQIRQILSFRNPKCQISIE